MNLTKYRETQRERLAQIEELEKEMWGIRLSYRKATSTKSRKEIKRLLAEAYENYKPIKQAFEKDCFVFVALVNCYLNDEERKIFLMRYREGLELSTIVERLNKSPKETIDKLERATETFLNFYVQSENCPHFQRAIKDATKVKKYATL